MKPRHSTHSRFHLDQLRRLSGMMLIAWFSVGCESVAEPELNYPCVSWCDTTAPWPHDGNPYQSENFTVYSDGASLQARMDVAEIAQGVLTDLKALLEIPSNDLFIFPTGQTKIHLYAFKNHNPTQWGGKGFWGGLFIYSLDHPEKREAGLTELGGYTRLLIHELTHVIQNLLVGSSHSYSTHTWFEEGLGEFVSALNPERSILRLTDLNDLIAQYGELNPIAIHNDMLPAIEGIGSNYFYPMFELTMRYLLDDQGLGHSLLDAKQVFLDMRDGMSFSDAFENNFGLSVVDFDAEYFVRIREYLN
jgi:hypothetical protein